MSEPHSIQAREEEIVEEFAYLDDWMQRYAHLIELGRDLPIIEPEYRTEEHRVHGCQSQVWLRAVPEGDRLHFRADSDAAITKGLVALLVRVLSGQRARDIAEARLEFLDRIGLKDHLSPSRSNGLANMVKKMKRYATEQAGGSKFKVEGSTFEAGKPEP